MSVMAIYRQQSWDHILDVDCRVLIKLLKQDLLQSALGELCDGSLLFVTLLSSDQLVYSPDK